MKSEYLAGVNRSASSYPGLDVIKFGNDTWYAGEYNVVKNAGFIRIKEEIVELTNRINKRITLPGNWDWHHVVETQHMSAFVLNSNLNREEYFNMPTILIHKPEHKFFSQNFNNNAFRELTQTTAGRKNNSISTYGDKAAIEKIKTSIRNLQMMYNNMYKQYPTLQKIANNVFNLHYNVVARMR